MGSVRSTGKGLGGRGQWEFSAPNLANSGEMDKAPTGIAGLDEATRGGLPRGRTTLVFGGPGAGKTILALQTLVNAARFGDEPGIFVTFEEQSRQVVANASSFGWNIPELEKRRLFFLDASLDPGVVRAGQFDLQGVLAALSAKVKEMKARRVVFDGLDVLLTLLSDPHAERTELYRIHEWIARSHLTGIVTAKMVSSDPFAQAHYEFAAYMADCALRLVRSHKDGVSERDVSILKYRGSSFSENKVPFVIGPAGLEVAYQQLSGELGLRPSRPTRSPNRRISTGVERLDTMLNGGYFRAASVLLTGLPGTAKSSLSGAFVKAACRRGERALYVTFDGTGDEIVRNLTSIKIMLRSSVESGQLRILSGTSLSDSAEVQLMRITSAILKQRATCVVIDPISALARASDPSTALGVVSRFIHWSKANGVTLLCTSLLTSTDPHAEASGLGISTLCDTWIHLAYVQKGGERNRSLSIVKSRGTGHSNQVRELMLSNEGITLADVYKADGEVLMGTMRWEHEIGQKEDAQRRVSEARIRRIEIEREYEQIRARAALLHSELGLKSVELGAAKEAEQSRVTSEKSREAERRQRRFADFGEPRGGRPPTAAIARPKRRGRELGT